MNILALPFDILVQVFESGSVAALLNLQLVCKTFFKLIATYETSISSNLSRGYSWTAEYGLGAPVTGTRTIKQLLWCAHLDVMFELATHFQGTRRGQRCSHLFSLNSGTELTKRLEHGLAVYQRCAAIVEDHHPTELQRKNPRRVFWLCALPKAKAINKNIYKIYIGGLSQIDVFDYELLYQLSARHARARLRCCPPCCTNIRGSNNETSLATRKPKTEGISWPALCRQRNNDLVSLWIKSCQTMAKNVFALFRRDKDINTDTSVEDEARPSITWEDYRVMPLGIRIAALPAAPRDDHELPTMMHQYIRSQHFIEARKAYIIFNVADRWTWYSPMQIHESINNDLGNGHCHWELVSR